jgi:hypothetical protein
VPISSSSDAAQSVYAYAVALCSAARVFTIKQIARHPQVSWRRSPIKRAHDIMAHFRVDFEVLPSTHGHPWIWRFTPAAKRRLGLKFRNVNPMSAKVDHWLSIGDLWATLTSHGLRPVVFVAEPQDTAGFDVFALLPNRRALVIEIQRTPITERDWRRKWELRYEWYKQRGWLKAPWNPPGKEWQPKPCLVTLCNQQKQTIGAPAWVVTARSFSDLARKLI